MIHFTFHWALISSFSLYIIESSQILWKKCSIVIVAGNTSLNQLNTDTFAKKIKYSSEIIKDLMLHPKKTKRQFCISLIPLKRDNSSINVISMIEETSWLIGGLDAWFTVEEIPWLHENTIVIGPWDYYLEQPIKSTNLTERYRKQ